MFRKDSPQLKAAWTNSSDPCRGHAAGRRADPALSEEHPALMGATFGGRDQEDQQIVSLFKKYGDQYDWTTSS